MTQITALRLALRQGWRGVWAGAARMAAARKPAQAEVHDLARTLADELKRVQNREPGAGQSYADCVAALEQSALCLSGGGVRSAAFSLGVVQALARAELLARFDYLSTVSGGGFIGGWLRTLIIDHGSVAAAQAAIMSPAERQPVEELRKFTNYLAPSGGLLSEDSWTGVLLYLRNVIINWLGFGPIFLLAVLSAICYRTLIWTFGSVSSPAAARAAVVCGLAGLVFATYRVAMDLPGHRPERYGSVQDGKEPDRAYSSPADIRTGIVLPVMVWCFGMPMAFGRWLAPGADPGIMLHAWLPVAYALAITAGYWIAGIRQRELPRYGANFTAWMAATLASALLLFGGMQLIKAAPGNLVPAKEQAEFLAVAGPLLLILANIMQATAYVALRREAVLADLDREWLARLSAVKLRMAGTWFCFALCCLTLPRMAFHSAKLTAGTWPAWLVPVATLLSGPAAAWLGKQTLSRVEVSITTAAGTFRLFRRVLPLLGMVFAAGLLSVLSLIASQTLGAVQDLLFNSAHAPPHLHLSLLAVQICAAAVLTLLICKASRQINVNRFSMHGMFRNRLTRAFLGTARSRRDADPFTGFDPQDNSRLASLLTAGETQKLFPVFNVTLNLNTSVSAAWTERKAAPFTMTPLACGSAVLNGGRGCYVPTALYGGMENESGPDEEPKGVTLATAMTISGAAVSPNWGYHSSPITAFLMTLFNLRLGAWLPNPAVVTDAGEMAQAKPRHAFWPMLSDLFATASASARAVYLSDGGHFDNLGLYEMLRRRCRLILLVDASDDFECQYGEFGSTIRRACIDALCRAVTFHPHMRIARRGEHCEDALDFAVASIVYPDDTEGRILYVKPCFLDDVPPDVRAYGAAHSYFPHQRTLEQAYTESQFESYRHLGEHQMARLIALMAPNAACLRPLFDAAEARQARVQRDEARRRGPHRHRRRYQPF